MEALAPLMSWVFFFLTIFPRVASAYAVLSWAFMKKKVKNIFCPWCPQTVFELFRTSSVIGNDRCCRDASIGTFCMWVWIVLVFHRSDRGYNRGYHFDATRLLSESQPPGAGSIVLWGLRVGRLAYLVNLCAKRLRVSPGLSLSRPPIVNQKDPHTDANLWSLQVAHPFPGRIAQKFVALVWLIMFP